MKIKSNGSITPNPFSIQQFNNNVDIKCFEIPRFYYGNTDNETDISELYDTNPVDLSKCSVVMRLSNPDDKINQGNNLFISNDKGENEFSDDDDKVIVNWIITNNVSDYAGKRTYQLEFYDGDVLAFRTQVMNFVVKESLDTESLIPIHQPTIFEEFEDKLNDIMNDTTNYTDFIVKEVTEQTNEVATSINNKVDNEISAIETKVNSLASGSPKGVYTDAEALKTANPETGVYIATGNGHIYSWTKNQSGDPIDLGVYQAPENSDTVNELVDEMKSRKYYVTNKFDECTRVGGGAYYFKDSLKSGYLKNIHVFSPQDDNNFRLTVWLPDRTTKLFEIYKTLSAGENIIDINKNIGEGYYFGFHAIKLYYSTNDLTNAVCNNETDFQNENFNQSYGFKVYFEYSNWNYQNYGRIIKNDDFDTIYIDTENLEISTSRALKIYDGMSYYDVAAQTIPFTYLTLLNTNEKRCQAVYLSVKDLSLYVSRVARNIEDLIIAVFDENKIYFGKENCTYKSVKYVFIGDSYCEGYSPDGNVTSWAQLLKTRMCAHDWEALIAYKGGSGFNATKDGINFLTLLQNADIPNKSQVEKIIVCGGYNDSNKTIDDVYNSCIAFKNYVRDNFPNATLYIGMIGYSTDATRRTKLKNIPLFAYQTVCDVPFAKYLTNSEFSLSDDLMASDGYHPNASGHEFISRNLYQALKTGCGFIQYNRTNL